MQTDPAPVEAPAPHRLQPGVPGSSTATAFLERPIARTGSCSACRAEGHVLKHTHAIRLGRTPYLTQNVRHLRRPEQPSVSGRTAETTAAGRTSRLPGNSDSRFSNTLSPALGIHGHGLSIVQDEQPQCTIKHATVYQDTSRCLLGELPRGLDDRKLLQRVGRPVAGGEQSDSDPTHCAQRMRRRLIDRFGWRRVRAEPRERGKRQCTTHEIHP